MCSQQSMPPPQSTGSTRERAWLAADSLARQGIRPTADLILKELGRGSKSTVLSALNEWWPVFLQRSADSGRPDNVPPEAFDLVMQLYDQISDKVTQQAAKKARNDYDEHYQESTKLVAEAQSERDMEIRARAVAQDRAEREAQHRESLEAKLASQQASNEQLREELAQAKGQKEALLAAIEGKEALIMAALEAKQEALLRLAKIEQELSNKETAFEQRLNTNAQAHEKQVKLLRGEVHELERSRTALTERLQASHENERRMRQEAKVMGEEFTALLSRERDELATWREKHTLLETDLGRANDTISSLRLELDDRDDRLGEAMNQIEELKRDLGASQSRD